MRPTPFVTTSAVLGLVLSVCGSAAAQSSFTGLGGAPGNVFYRADAVSADGSTVVGQRGVLAVHSEACYWTRAGGIVGLGDFEDGGSYSRAVAVSADGSVIVGQGSHPTGYEPFRWTHATGLVGLGDLPGGDAFGCAFGVSGDGRIVVGVSTSSASGGYNEAFRWTEGTGIVGLGDGSLATGVSADGSIIVGYFRPIMGGVQACRWTEGEGMVGLFPPPMGASSTAAEAICNDGSLIVGLSQSGSAVEAFRWTADGQAIGMSDLPGGELQALALAVSVDGSVIVGRGHSLIGEEAFVWTQASAAAGLRSLRDVLRSEGVANLTEWRLSVATGVSADGKTIVGYGVNPCGQDEAWIARLDGLALPPCPADVNENGTTSPQDIFDFLALFFADDRRADFNGNCAVTPQDIFDFLAAFFAACT